MRFIRYIRSLGMRSGVCFALLGLVGVVKVRAELPAQTQAAEIAKWRKTCAGIDPARDPGGWCLAAENLANLLWHEGGGAEAEMLLRRIVERRTKLYGAEHPRTLNSMAYLALYLVRQDSDESERLYRAALSGLEKKLGINHGDTRLVMSNLASMLRRKGDYAGAEPLVRRMLALHEKERGVRDWRTNETVGDLADVLKAKGDYAAAVPLYRRYLDGQKEAIGPDTIEVASTAYDFSIVCEKLNRDDEALALAKEAVEHARKDKSNRPEKLPLFEKRLAELEAAAK